MDNETISGQLLNGIKEMSQSIGKGDDLGEALAIAIGAFLLAKDKKGVIKVFDSEGKAIWSMKPKHCVCVCTCRKC